MTTLLEDAEEPCKTIDEGLGAYLAGRGIALHTLDEGELVSRDCEDWDEHADEADEIFEMSIDEIAATYGIDYALWYVGSPHLL